MMDLSRRASYRNIYERRGLVLPGGSPTVVVESEWAPLVRAGIESADSDFWTFRGEASIVDHPYTVRDMFGEFQETIRAGAFTKTLSENPDVMFNYMHEPITTMATTRGAGGLTLSATPHLGVEARVPRSDVLGQTYMPIVARGDAASMSFAFRVAQQVWDEDYTDRQITEINMHRGDVASIISGFGANPPAWGSVRAIGYNPQVPQREPDETVNCKHCGYANDTDAVFCDQCGFQMGGTVEPYTPEPEETVQCPQCGRMNDSDAKFCDQCGFSLEGFIGLTQNSFLSPDQIRDLDARFGEKADFLKQLVAVQLRSRA